MNHDESMVDARVFHPSGYSLEELALHHYSEACRGEANFKCIPQE